MSMSARISRAGSTKGSSASARSGKRRGTEDSDTLSEKRTISGELVSRISGELVSNPTPTNRGADSTPQSDLPDLPKDFRREERRPSKRFFTNSNQSQAIETSIRVVVRVRPKLPKESTEKEGVKVTTGGKALVLTNGQDQRQFGVDAVFDSRTEQGSQTMIFDYFGKNFVEQSLQGYNVCIFAYGHTGSGKTFTMLGDAWGLPGTKVHERGAGLVPRFLREIFQVQAQDPRFKEMQYSCEFYEVYNDQIRDLLAPNNSERKRKVHVHPKHGVRIEGSSPSLVSSAEEALGLLHFGNQMRTVSSTTMNERSSRSHAILTFKFVQLGQEFVSLGSGADSTTGFCESTVTFADLAGREDQGASNNKEMQFREMRFINTSLFHLAHLITKLAEGQVEKASLTDFRNSKLTLLLSQALIGNSRTALVATVAPLQCYFEDSVSTMAFAQTVRKIQTCAVVNDKGSGGVVAELEAEVRMLRKELEGSKTNASEKEIGLVAAEALIEYYKRSFEEATSRSQEMKDARSRFTLQYGISDPAVKIQQSQTLDLCPYFTKLSDDPSLQGCCNYLLKKSTLRIGSDEQSCDIVLRGLGIAPQMCEVRQDPADGRVYVEVSNLAVGGPIPRVLVNGIPMNADMSPRCMEHGDSIILGYAHAFRLVKPTRTHVAQVGTDNLGMLARSTIPRLDMASAIAEIEEENGMQFQEVYPFLQQLSSHAPESVVSSFLKALHCLCPLVDEANLITREVFGGEEVHFQLYTLTNPFSHMRSHVPEFAVCLLQRARGADILENAELLHDDIDVPQKTQHPMLHTLGLADNMMVDGRELLYVWALEKFLRRLNEIRDLYQEGSEAQDSFSSVWQRISNNPFLNPWTEPRFADLKLFAEDVAQILNQLAINPPIMSLITGGWDAVLGSASTGISAPSELTQLTPPGSVSCDTPGGSIEAPLLAVPSDTGQCVSPTPVEVPKLSTLSAAYATQPSPKVGSLHSRAFVPELRLEETNFSPGADPTQSGTTPASGTGFQGTTPSGAKPSVPPSPASVADSQTGSARVFDSAPHSARSSLLSVVGGMAEEAGSRSGIRASVPRLPLSSGTVTPQSMRGDGTPVRKAGRSYAMLGGREAEKTEEVCCPRGHELKKVDRTHKGWFCHACGRVSSNAKMECFRCSSCNYNLCDRCYEAEAGASADSEDEEEEPPSIADAVRAAQEGSRPQGSPRSVASRTGSVRGRRGMMTPSRTGMITPSEAGSVADSTYGERPMASVKCDLDSLRRRLADIITGGQPPPSAVEPAPSLPSEDDVSTLGGLSQEARLADLLDRFESMMTKLNVPSGMVTPSQAPAPAPTPTATATAVPQASITWPIVPVLGSTTTVRTIAWPAPAASPRSSSTMPVARMRSLSPGRPGWCSPVALAVPQRQAPSSARSPSPPPAQGATRSSRGMGQIYTCRSRSASPSGIATVVRQTSPMMMSPQASTATLRVAGGRRPGDVTPRDRIAGSGAKSLTSSARGWPLQRSTSHAAGTSTPGSVISPTASTAGKLPSEAHRSAISPTASTASTAAGKLPSEAHRSGISPTASTASTAGKLPSEGQRKLARSPNRSVGSTGAETPVRTQGRFGGKASSNALATDAAANTSQPIQQPAQPGSATTTSAGTTAAATEATTGGHRWTAVPL